MTEPEARSMLKVMVAWKSDPELTEEEITMLLNMGRVTDPDGRLVTDDDWVPTWNMEYCAYRGWLLKAGKATEEITFRAGDLASYNADMHKHCMEQANSYAKMLNTSFSVYNSPTVW